MWGSGAQAPGSLHMGFAPVSGGTELLASFLFLKALPSPSVEPKRLRIAGHYTGEERELFPHKCYLLTHMARWVCCTPLCRCHYGRCLALCRYVRAFTVVGDIGGF